MRQLLAIVLMFTLTACATVQHGPVQRIAVDSEPQGALVRTAHCGPGATKEVRTPGEIWVSRRAEHCTLTFTARDHYAEQVTLHRELAEEFFENAELLCWGKFCERPTILTFSNKLPLEIKIQSEKSKSLIR